MKYSKGVFVSQEQVDLEEGKEVVVCVGEVASATSVVESLRVSANRWIGMHDPEHLERIVYEARIAGSRQKRELYQCPSLPINPNWNLSHINTKCMGQT